MDYLLGVLSGILISVLNILVYKKEVQAQIRKIISQKKEATFIDTTVPFADLDL